MNSFETLENIFLKEDPGIFREAEVFTRSESFESLNFLNCWNFSKLLKTLENTSWKVFWNFWKDLKKGGSGDFPGGRVFFDLEIVKALSFFKRFESFQKFNKLTTWNNNSAFIEKFWNIWKHSNLKSGLPENPRTLQKRS